MPEIRAAGYCVPTYVVMYSNTADGCCLLVVVVSKRLLLCGGGEVYAVAGVSPRILVETADRLNIQYSV